MDEFRRMMETQMWLPLGGQPGTDMHSFGVDIPAAVFPGAVTV